MTEIDKKLEFLYDLLLDNFDDFRLELEVLILNPEKIDNHYKFASLLVSLNNPVFINPLLKTIAISNNGDLWLTNLMYAAIELLDEASEEDEFDMPKGLIEKLGNLILEHRGEISWKAANLLKFYSSATAEKIQLKKLEERKDDFFLTYIECILGLLQYNKEKHMPLVKAISTDEARDKKLREFAAKMVKSYY